MSNYTTASLFTGGAGWEIGAMMAGFRPVWGVEIRPDIAAVAERNIIGLRVIVSDVAAVDYSSLERPDHLHASPSCKNASNANSKGEEAQEDLSSAKAVCRAIRVLKPSVFTLENVWWYRNFEAFKMIAQALRAEGYFVDWWHLNSANYGVPQTRKRLVLIARLDRQPRKPAPTHSQNPGLFGLYKPWIGWYEAILDLIPNLPETQPAPWQLARLPEELMTYVIDQVNYSSNTIREASEPIMTVSVYSSKHPEPKAYLTPVQGLHSEGFLGDRPAQTVGAGHRAGKYRAFIVPGDNTGNTTTIRRKDQPMVTIQIRDLGRCPHRAYLLNKSADKYGDGVADDDRPAFTVVSNSQGRYNAHTAGRWVKLTPRCLARFQSLPDSYVLPDGNGLACEVIGNAVPPLLAKAVCESLG